MTGKIVKGIAGFYYVAVEGSGIYECKAKGLFRREGIKPLVGDLVKIKILDEKTKEANIEEILPRKNELYRPAVANVDQMLLFMALADPEPSFGVMDRMLIQMELLELPVTICFNKSDLVEKEKKEEVLEMYEKAGYQVVLASTKDESGLEEIRKLLRKKTTVFAGPSGVGKSSMTNALSGEYKMETGSTSAKLKKGKHTTRHSQLIVLDAETYICDTPGFTSFSPEKIEKEELKDLFPEIRRFEGKCRFQGCVHVHEPDCAVKEAVKRQIISSARYESYLQLFTELKEQEKNKYK